MRLARFRSLCFADWLWSVFRETSERFTLARDNYLRTNRDLSLMKIELSAAKRDLSAAKRELSTTKRELSAIKRILVVAQRDQERYAALRKSFSCRLGFALTAPARFVLSRLRR